VDLIGEHYDLAIRMGTLESDSTLVVRKIGEQHFGLYASPIYLTLKSAPEQPDDLMRHETVRLQPANGKPVSWRLTRGKNTWEGAPGGRISVNALGMIQQLLLDGVGIGALPESFVKEDVCSGRLVRILADWEFPVTPAWAVMPTRRYLPAKSRAFLAHLEKFLSKASGD
jgi:DNA-binding transcriptional LysR family regulator